MPVHRIDRYRQVHCDRLAESIDEYRDRTVLRHCASLLQQHGEGVAVCPLVTMFGLSILVDPPNIDRAASLLQRAVHIVIYS